jgi:hypothetical protein
MKWYWSNYLENDDIAIYARLWQKMGMLGTFVWFFFLLMGTVCWFVAMFQLDKLPHSPVTNVLLCALLSSIAFGLFASLYAGLAVASLAHNTQRRLTDLEERLAKLEPTVIKSP